MKKLLQSAIPTHVQQQHKLTTLGSLTAGVVHDLNNIFTSMDACLSLLAEDSDAKYREAFVTSLLHAKQLTKTISQFMKCSDKTMDIVNPIDCLQEVSYILEHTLPSAIQFHLDVSSSVHPVEISYGDLSQIFLNLIVNARDAIEGSGNIKVSGGYTHEHDNLMFILEIEDDGAGIKEEQLHHIFTPFFSTKDSDQGTGLGLSIVHNIVHAAQGHITIDSIYGEKTQCTVLIPVKSPPAS